MISGVSHHPTKDVTGSVLWMIWWQFLAEWSTRMYGKAAKSLVRSDPPGLSSLTRRTCNLGCADTVLTAAHGALTDDQSTKPPLAERARSPVATRNERFQIHSYRWTVAPAASAHVFFHGYACMFTGSRILLPPRKDHMISFLFDSRESSCVGLVGKPAATRDLVQRQGSV